eukprot:m.18445 g.18445  ORF g.18445 m.18445 type:complete len:757 (+) comp6313_c0_seq1:382-2652(+)
MNMNKLSLTIFVSWSVFLLTNASELPTEISVSSFEGNDESWVPLGAGVTTSQSNGVLSVSGRTANWHSAQTILYNSTTQDVSPGDKVGLKYRLRVTSTFTGVLECWPLMHVKYSGQSSDNTLVVLDNDRMVVSEKDVWNTPVERVDRFGPLPSDFTNMDVIKVSIRCNDTVDYDLDGLIVFKGDAGLISPHIVVMVADDQGWGNIEYNNDNVKTPTMKELADDGIKLTRMYTSPATSPSRTSLMTGQLPGLVNHDGVYDLNGATSFLSKILFRRGYHSHIVGKWGIAPRSLKHSPFQTEIGFRTGMIHFGETDKNMFSSDIKTRCNVDNATDLWGQAQSAGDAGPRVNNGEYSTLQYADEVTRIIDSRNTARPLFLYLAPAKHGSFAPPSNITDRYTDTSLDNKFIKYNGGMTAFDDLLKHTKDELIRTNMWDDTLLIYLSDNGGHVCKTGKGNNFPLRGGMKTYFEGGVRVPSFVAGGILSSSHRGTTRNGYLHVADLMKTVSMASGMRYAPSNDASSLSFNAFDYLFNPVAEPDSPRENVLLSIYHHCKDLTNGETNPKGAYIEGHLKLIIGDINVGFVGPQCSSWVANKKSAGFQTECPEYSTSTSTTSSTMDEVSPFLYPCPGPDLLNCTNGCLFNITEDEQERTNIAAEYPTIVAAMKANMTNLCNMANEDAEDPLCFSDATYCNELVPANWSRLPQCDDDRITTSTTSTTSTSSSTLSTTTISSTTISSITSSSTTTSTFCRLVCGSNIP